MGDIRKQLLEDVAKAVAKDASCLDILTNVELVLVMSLVKSRKSTLSICEKYGVRRNTIYRRLKTFKEGQNKL